MGVDKSGGDGNSKRKINQGETSKQEKLVPELIYQVCVSLLINHLYIYVYISYIDGAIRCNFVEIM